MDTSKRDKWRARHGAGTMSKIAWFSSTRLLLVTALTGLMCTGLVCTTYKMYVPKSEAESKLIAVTAQSTGSNGHLSKLNAFMTSPPVPERYIQAAEETVSLAQRIAKLEEAAATKAIEETAAAEKAKEAKDLRQY